jgi:hypothetical protein
MFALGVAIASGLAPVAWGDAPWYSGIFALAGGLLVAWLIWLAFRRGDVAAGAPVDPPAA